MEMSSWPAVVRFCADECARQHSGEKSVADMFDAWEFVWHNLGNEITVDDILELGRVVEPLANQNGFRRVPVLIGGIRSGVVPSEIGRQLVYLTETVNEGALTPVEFYTEFERIHPFNDGNGRVGALLYNWLNGSGDEPVAPPDVFKPAVSL